MELGLQGDIAKILDWLICLIIGPNSTLQCFINGEWISLSGLFGFPNRSSDNTLRKSFCEISFSARQKIVKRQMESSPEHRVICIGSVVFVVPCTFHSLDCCFRL